MFVNMGSNTVTMAKRGKGRCLRRGRHNRCLKRAR